MHKESNIRTNGPLVTVLMPTFNRLRYFSIALKSVLHQNYRNLQIIVVNDGGEDVREVVESFSDDRVLLINRKENRGKAYSLNEALRCAKGKYVAYLDDDDLFYPNHIETLVNALESHPEIGLAYSDLYKVYYREESDGVRTALSKEIEVSRDFDRFLMLCFNHVLHVSLMHRRELIEKTGFYNEQLNVLIDWDLTRRLAFYTDFLHVKEVTGEYYVPSGKSDRISTVQRKNKESYGKQVLQIRMTRPPKPWPKIDDLSIVLLPSAGEAILQRTLREIMRCTFYPFKIYLAVEEPQKYAQCAALPNVEVIRVAPNTHLEQRIDATLWVCESAYVAVILGNLPIRTMWIEDPLRGLIQSSKQWEAIELDSEAGCSWGAVFRRQELAYIREHYEEMSLVKGLQAQGLCLRKLQPNEIAFQFDQLLEEARQAERDGNWSLAAEMYEYIRDHYQNELWMNTCAANALYKSGAVDKALQMVRTLNTQRPVVDTLLLEARIHKSRKDYGAAVSLLENAKHILQGSELVWT